MSTSSTSIFSICGFGSGSCTGGAFEEEAPPTTVGFGGGAGGNVGGLLGATASGGTGGTGGTSGGISPASAGGSRSTDMGVSRFDVPIEDQNSTSKVLLFGASLLNSAAFITSATFALFSRRCHITTQPKGDSPDDMKFR